MASLQHYLLTSTTYHNLSQWWLSMIIFVLWMNFFLLRI